MQYEALRFVKLHCAKELTERQDNPKKQEIINPNL
jgi:hypothetical protein